MAASEKVSQIEGYHHLDSTGRAWFHTKCVNLRMGIIQVSVRDTTKDFWARVVGETVELFFKEDLSWASSGLLTSIIKYIIVLQ
jgi:hypothetical protein